MTRILPAALIGLITLFQQQASAQMEVSVSTTLALTVETVIPLAPGPEVNPGGPIQNATCTADTLSCPACNGQNITDSNGSTYAAHCSSYISSSAISQQPTLLTPSECLLACDGFFGCTGAYITDDGNCTLAIGALFGMLDLDGYTAFVSMGDIIETIGNTTISSVSESPSSTGLPSSAPAPYANISSSPPLLPRVPLATGTVPLNITWPSTNGTAYNATPPYPVPGNVTTAYGTATTPWAIATAPAHPPYSNNTVTANATMSSNSTCSLKHLSCPACNNQTITDLYNTTYTVLCDTSLTSTSQYAFAEPLPASYCMAECDERNATCVGAYWTDEECTLALGTYKDTLANPGYIAFLRQAAAWPVITSLPVPTQTTAPTWLNMSMYNAGPNGSAGATAVGTGISSLSASNSWTETVTSAYAGFPPAPTCDPQAVGCPECDGLVIVDGLNNTYRTQCNFAPSCDNTLGLYGSYSLNMCMERCDADATCLAAVYNDHHCDLCQRGMEGTYDESADYLVLIPEEVEVSTAVSLTATISSLTSVLATTFSNPASVTFAPLTAPTTSLISIHTAPGLPSPLPTVRTTPVSAPAANISIAASSETGAAVPTAAATAISCPDSDHKSFEGTGGEFFIECDHTLGAASERSAFVVDFGTCADQCVGDCGGAQWDEDSSDCLLLTSVSVLAYSAGWTAGIRVWEQPASTALPVAAESASVSEYIEATSTSTSVSVPVPVAYTGPPPGLFPTFSSSPSTTTTTVRVTLTPTSPSSLSAIATTIATTNVLTVTSTSVSISSLATDVSGFETSTTVQVAVSTGVPVGDGVPYNGPPSQRGPHHGGGGPPRGQGEGGYWFPSWFGGRAPR